MSAERAWRGLPGAPGSARGQAFVLTPGIDPYAAPPGAVLVARLIHPHLAPLLLHATALVVEEGALLQHATTLAREFGVPAVVGAAGITGTVRQGEWLEVDGDSGSVRVEGGDR